MIDLTGKVAVVTGGSRGIGNANDESMTDIWHGTRLRDFRMMHLTGNRKDNPACAHCDYLRALPDNIDSDRWEYIKRYA